MGFSAWAINLILTPIFLCLCDQYALLPETDPACSDKSKMNRLYNFPLVDDMIIHEQLLLTWHPFGIYVNPSNSSSLSKLYPNFKRSLSLVVCPGVFISPAGRFVRKSFSDGTVSFWLLYAKATLFCPTNGQRVVDDYAVHIDQWLEPNVGSDMQSHLYPTSFNPVINQTPDNSIHLNCSAGVHVVTSNIQGYVRKLHITWQLNGSFSEPNSSRTTAAVSPNQPDFGVSIRITPRMLFRGNFTRERERWLCEFFSGFWCDSVLLPDANLTITKPPSGCIQASMRCDGHADCDLPSAVTSGLEPEHLSRDEIKCDSFYFSNQSNQPLNSTNTDKWTSRLPLMVLAPVPLVLFCALVRICSQKRRLYIADTEYIPDALTNPIHQIDGKTPNPDNSKPDAWTEKINLIRAKTRRWVPKYGRVYTSATALSSVTEAEDEHDVTLDLSAHRRSSTDPDIVSTTANEMRSEPDHCQSLFAQHPSTTGFDRRSLYLCWSPTAQPISGSSSCSFSSSSSSTKSSHSSLDSRRSSGSSTCSNCVQAVHTESFGDLHCMSDQQAQPDASIVDSLASEIQFQNTHFMDVRDLTNLETDCCRPSASTPPHSDKDPLSNDCHIITVEAVVNRHVDDLSAFPMVDPLLNSSA